MSSRSGGASAGPSHRQLRVGENVRHALADILQRETLFDPALKGVFVTVPEVRMTPDLKLATCYVMPLGGGDVEKVVAALERQKKFLRGELAKRIEMRFVPDMRFRPDESFDRGAAMDRLLASPEVQRDVTKARDGGDE
jgi:ribosome-binding factor A